jgi:hypothetical protein
MTFRANQSHQGIAPCIGQRFVAVQKIAKPSKPKMGELLRKSGLQMRIVANPMVLRELKPLLKGRARGHAECLAMSLSGSKWREA